MPLGSKLIVMKKWSIRGAKLNPIREMFYMFGVYLDKSSTNNCSKCAHQASTIKVNDSQQIVSRPEVKNSGLAHQAVCLTILPSS